MQTLLRRCARCRIKSSSSFDAFLNSHRRCVSLISSINGYKRHLEWRSLLFLCGIGIAIGSLQRSYYNQRIIAEQDIDDYELNEEDQKQFRLYEYQLKVAEFAEKEEYDELIKFLWKELIKIASSGKGDGNIIDFLENKLCGYLCLLGKSDEAVRIIEQYTEKELIDNQSLLRVAFVYHSDGQFEKAIDLYKLSLDHMDQQLKNRIREDHLPKMKKEIELTVNMQLAQCYTGLNQLETVKNIYSDLEIDDIIGFGVDGPILEWYKNFGTKEEAEGFESFIKLHKTQNPKFKH